MLYPYLEIMAVLARGIEKRGRDVGDENPVNISLLWPSGHVGLIQIHPDEYARFWKTDAAKYFKPTQQ